MRTFVDDVFRFQREQARRIGIRKARSGAVLFPQRFGGSLNLNVHYHVAVPDGAYTRDAVSERGEFHALSGPTATELEDIAFNVEMRTVRFLKRKGLMVDAVDCDTGVPADRADRTALDACLEGSLGVGELIHVAPREDSHVVDESPSHSPDRRRRWVFSRGFNVHAGVVIGAEDRLGRERLLRYCARPPFSLKRLSLTEDGQVLYQIKGHDRRGRTHRRMTPIEFLARLCALIPPPRHPLIVFHGVYAPHSSWRRSVVPERHACQTEVRSCHACDDETGDSTARSTAVPSAPGIYAASRDSTQSGHEPPNDFTHTPQSAVALRENGPGTSCSSQTASEPQPAYCSSYALQHPSARIDWAELLKRVHAVDALRCDCGGRLRFIALVTDPKVAKPILERLHLVSLPPPLPRARAPDFDECA